MSRRWHWKIDELEQGPDYVFRMDVSAAEASRLHQRIEQWLPTAYIANDLSPRPARFTAATLYSGYVDRMTYGELRATQNSNSPPSLWFYGEIHVVDHQLHLRHVLAGGRYDDTALIVNLAKSTELTVTYWHVSFAGYEWGDVACGQSAADLLAYLDC